MTQPTIQSTKKSKVCKTCVSLTEKNRKRLANVRNRSLIINTALQLYFDKIEYMKNVEIERMKKSGGQQFLIVNEQMNDLSYMDGRDFTKEEINELHKDNPLNDNNS